jgi:hypothetical protein
MSTPAKELIAVAHIALISSEPALKQLTTIFNRIALPWLSVALRPDAARFHTPEFIKNRQRLVDLGILYEPDVKSAPAPDSDTRNSILSLLADANEILKPFGTSVEEMLAARNNQAELKRIRERTSLPNDELAARIPDHQKLMQTEKRITVNTTRMSAIQVRSAESSAAYATIPSGDSSLDEDDQRPNKHDVLKIAVVVPVPEDQAPWQHIIEFRNDPDSQGGFFELKEWMSDIARGVITQGQAQQKLESLLDQYRRVLQRHQIQINWTKLEAFVVTSADDTRFQQRQSASPLFAVEHRKLALLEAESTLPGSIVAFVLQAKSMFEMEQA